MVETTCGELTTAPIPHPLHCLVEGGRTIGNEVEPGKKEGGGRKIKICSYFLLSYSNLIGNVKLISLSLVRFACDSNWSE